MFQLCVSDDGSGLLCDAKECGVWYVMAKVVKSCKLGERDGTGVNALTCLACSRPGFNSRNCIWFPEYPQE